MVMPVRHGIAAFLDAGAAKQKPVHLILLGPQHWDHHVGFVSARHSRMMLCLCCTRCLCGLCAAAIPASAIPASIEYVRAGSLRALAITIRTRFDALPDIPTVSEFVPGYEATSMYGLGGPKNMPAAIIERLNKEINAGLADPKIKAGIADLGVDDQPIHAFRAGQFACQEDFQTCSPRKPATTRTTTTTPMI
jgi:hypothetical protein